MAQPVSEKKRLKMVIEIAIKILDGHHKSLFKPLIWKEIFNIDHRGFPYPFWWSVGLSSFRQRALVWYVWSTGAHTVTPGVRHSKKKKSWIVSRQQWRMRVPSESNCFLWDWQFLRESKDALNFCKVQWKFWPGETVGCKIEKFWDKRYN